MLDEIKRSGRLHNSTDRVGEVDRRIVLDTVFVGLQRDLVKY